MRITKAAFFCLQAMSLLLLSSAIFLPAKGAISEEPIASKAPIEEEMSDISKVGIEAYIYGYPLVTMEMTRRIMTNTACPFGKYAPVGQFVHLREYPKPADKEVTAPNADTLYSLAWLDVSKEPYILTIPEAQGRYYLMPMLDAWTNVFADPGTRTTGTKTQKYAITGPHWSGQLPKAIKEYKSPTNLLWIIGRTYCNGTVEDYMKVHAFQDAISLVPLSAYDKDYSPTPGVVDPDLDMKDAVRDQVNQMDAETYFQLLAQLLKNNPPAPMDKAVVAEIAKVGIIPGEDFDINKLDLETASSLSGVPQVARAKIMAHIKDAGTCVNGWMKPSKAGTYGNDYLQRAFIAIFGLGANLTTDAIYPTSEVDSNCQPYNGTNKYVMHFAKGQMPPVNGFWSLTMYDGNYFFVPNILDRYNVSSRSQFKHNVDGSTDLYIQKDSPGKDKESNWLPCPDGKFILMLRMYWPKPEVTEGKYVIPAVQQVN